MLSDSLPNGLFGYGYRHGVFLLTGFDCDLCLSYLLAFDHTLAAYDRNLLIRRFVGKLLSGCNRSSRWLQGQLLALLQCYFLLKAVDLAGSYRLLLYLDGDFFLKAAGQGNGQGCLAGLFTSFQYAALRYCEDLSVAGLVGLNAVTVCQTGYFECTGLLFYFQRYGGCIDLDGSL